MLPYTYQDLAQNVIATDVFANNILMSIKSADYWNVLNDYKPLMHTWYLGIIVQFYVFFSMIVIVGKKTIKTKKNITVYIVGVCLILSLVLYMMPNFTATQKFYFLPFRIFEFCAGCMTAYWMKSKNESAFAKKPLMSVIAIMAYLLTFGLLFINAEYISAPIKLISIVALTCILLLSLPKVNMAIDKVISHRWLAVIGKASFSIYIWHQIVFAFCRYSFTSVFDAKIFLITILLTGVLSYVTYIFVEQAISNYLRKKQGERNTLIGCVSFAALLLGVSLYLNSCSGVVRDVPELEVYVGKTSDRMHIAYNEEGYTYDRDFTSEDKLHWVVVGDSYGRDFVNILREMRIEDEIEISYIKQFQIRQKANIERIKESDLIFRTMTIIPKSEHIDDFYSYTDSLGIPREKVVIVGSKRFGYSLGQIYAKRNQSDYFSLTTDIKDWYLTQNKEFYKKCDGRYIDMITPVLVGDNRVRVFTDDHKIISQDCEHLTKNGAVLYADLLRPIIEQYIGKVFISIHSD